MRFWWVSLIVLVIFCLPAVLRVAKLKKGTWKEASNDVIDQTSETRNTVNGLFEYEV